MVGGNPWEGTLRVVVGMRWKGEKGGCQCVCVQVLAATTPLSVFPAGRVVGVGVGACARACACVRVRVCMLRVCCVCCVCFVCFVRQQQQFCH